MVCCWKHETPHEKNDEKSDDEESEKVPSFNAENLLAKNLNNSTRQNFSKIGDTDDG